MQKATIMTLLILASVALATDIPTGRTSVPPAAVQSGLVFEHIDSIYDRQGNLIGGDVDGASMDSLYWRPANTNYLYVSPKVDSPTPTQRTAMSFHNGQARPCMDPHGDFVYEVNSSNLYRFSTVDGSMTTYALSPSGSATGCATDGQYVYVPSSMTSETIYKYTMTGTYVNTTVLDLATEQWGMSICRDTFWANPSMGVFTYYAYPTSQFNGGSINYVTSWDVGSGSPFNLGNIAYDGTYFYVAWMGESGGTFRRFYSDRTPWTKGKVYIDSRSCMAMSVPHPPGDVGTLRVIAPTGDIPYGVPVVPQAKVRNYSSVAQSFPVHFDIDTVYSSTVYVDSLQPNDSVTVSFDTFPATAPGSHAVKCSTLLSSDTVRTNDKATDACFVSVVDVGTRAVLAPTGTIPYGTPVAPQARVKNFGAAAATFTAKFTIGTFYRDSQTVSDLPAGESLVVNFADWAADTAGTFATQCSTRLSGDQIPADDKAIGAVAVDLTDAGGWCITAPAGSGVIDSGTTVTPRCTAANYGTQAATFDVDMRIAPSYFASGTATIVPPNSRKLVAFSTSYTAVGRGWVAMRCSTKLSSDQRPANDRKRDSVFIRVRDAGAVRINSPVGAILPGTIIPSADVRNWGNVREACKVFFRINSSPAYLDSVVLPAGLPYADTNLNFMSWNAVGGSYTARCSTSMTGDVVLANNVVTAQFVVGSFDVGVTQIVAPVGSGDTNVPQTPSAKLRNTGSAPATGVQATFTIDDGTDVQVYTNTKSADVPAGGEVTVVFDVWPAPHALGTYTTKCKAVTAGDPNPANDSLMGTYIVSTGPPGWKLVSPMPAGAKAIKDGGWLAYDAGSADGTGLIYASRGNKQPDFFSYSPVSDGWTPLSPWLPGTEAKLPGKGSAGCADGNGTIYATKGNNKSGFYKYDAAANTWTQLKDVPLGPSNKKVKGGTGIAWAYQGGIGCAYLLKGYKNEFYKYVPGGDSWVMLTPAPVGGNAKWDKGSWLTSDGAHTLYAAKAKYQELYSYNTETDSWSGPLVGMPAAGSSGSKKQKDGSCGVSLPGGRDVYSLKGGNTQEFWMCTFTTDGNSWAEKETIPKGSLKKKVKAGAGIVAVGTNLYATKGNKSNELWKYVPGAFAAMPQPGREGVVSSSFPVPRSSFIVSPNPLASGFATVSFTGALEHSGTGALRLSIYDATGRLVRQSAIYNLQSAMVLDLRSMPAGVYLLKVTAPGFSATRKLVVQR